MALLTLAVVRSAAAGMRIGGAAGRGPHAAVTIDDFQQTLPKGLAPQYFPVGYQLIKHLATAALAFLPQMIDARLQTEERSDVAEQRFDALPFLGCKAVQIGQPHVAIVHLAQQRLHSLDGVDASSSSPPYSGRAISTVYRSRLAAIRMAWCPR